MTRQFDLFDKSPTEIIPFPPARLAGEIRKVAATALRLGLDTEDGDQTVKLAKVGALVWLGSLNASPNVIARMTRDFNAALDAEIVRQRLFGPPVTAPKAG